MVLAVPECVSGGGSGLSGERVTWSSHSLQAPPGPLYQLALTPGLEHRSLFSKPTTWSDHMGSIRGRILDPRDLHL